MGTMSLGEGGGEGEGGSCPILGNFLHKRQNFFPFEDFVVYIFFFFWFLFFFFLFGFSLFWFFPILYF
jgi:hypothetical protein